MNLRLQIDENTLTYGSGDSFHWSLPVDRLVLIAEYTNDEGPYLDDYFLVFVTIEKGQTFFSTASFYAEGTDTAFASLERKFGQSVRLELCNSADWKSRVVWPPNLVGREYFTFAKLPPKNILETLRSLLLGSVYEYFVSKQVREYLDEQRRLQAP